MASNEEREPVRVRCRACDELVAPGRFCAQCGLALPLVGRGEQHCTSCGGRLGIDARFCSDCGAPAR